jgi:hypothetical protein
MPTSKGADSTEAVTTLRRSARLVSDVGVVIGAA